MTDDVDPGDLHIVETAPAADAGGDVVHGRAPRPPRRWPMHPSWLAGLLAVALLVGIGIGYLIGRRPDRDHPAAAPTTSAPAGTALVEPQALNTVTTCYGIEPTTGAPVMVGVNLVNEDSRPLVLTGVQGVFPLGGLRQVGSQVGQCDNNATAVVSGHQIAPSASIWLSLILDVQVRCPAPLPVQLRIDYTVGGLPATQIIAPFPDLSRASYPGCPTR